MGSEPDALCWRRMSRAIRSARSRAKELNARRYKKGQLVELHLEPRTHNFDQAIVERSTAQVLEHIRVGFQRLPRAHVNTVLHLDDISFWAMLVRQAQNVGPRPFALISVRDFPDIYRKIRSIQGRDTDALRFQLRDPGGRKAAAGYRFSVNEVDVYSWNIPQRSVTVASQEILTSLEFRNVPDTDVPFKATFVAAEGPQSETLKIQWAPRSNWATSKIIEVHAAATEGK